MAKDVPNDRYYRFSKREIPQGLRNAFSEQRWRHNRRFLRVVSLVNLLVGALFLTRRLFFRDVPGGAEIHTMYLVDYLVLLGIAAVYFVVSFAAGRRAYSPLFKYGQGVYILAMAVNYCFLNYIDLQLAPDFSAGIGVILFLSVAFWMNSGWYLAVLGLINGLVWLGFAHGVHPSVTLGEITVQMTVFSVVGVGLFFAINDGRTRNFVNERLLEKSVEKLEFLSHRDFLTKLYNRRLMIEDIEAQFALTRRTGRSFSVILTDMDHFKRINDGLGHAVGDVVLKESAALLISTARESDRIYRYGGEEFLILLPETPLENAVHLAVRLGDRFRGNAFTGVPWKVTMSMGLSGSEERHLAEDLVKLADIRLYAAKKGGRDRYVAEGYNEAADNGGAEIPLGPGQ